VPPYLTNGKAYSLQAWYTDDPHHKHTQWPRKVKGQGHQTDICRDRKSAISSEWVGLQTSNSVCGCSTKTHIPEFGTNLHKKVFYYSVIVFVHLIFLTFVSCLLTVTLHLVDVRLTCLINIAYLQEHPRTTILTRKETTLGERKAPPSQPLLRPV